MLVLDGSEGGGQVVRLAVGLAALEGRPVTVEDVRGARPKPGLRPQHVAAVEAVATLSNATTGGVAVGSDTVTIDPGDTIGGSVSVDVGTAGSIGLIFDAVLPLVLGAEDPIRVEATGGTHVKWAPTVDYLQSVKLPLLRSLGLEASIGDVTYGFYPAGGGTATFEAAPSTIRPLAISDRGAFRSLAIKSIETAGLASADVADRQVTGVTEALESEVSGPISAESITVEADSTGTAVLVIARYEEGVAGFTALGERGRPAETVGADAAGAFLEWQATGAALDRYLADQLLPFLAVAGGQYTVPAVTAHVKAARNVLAAFGYDVDVQENEKPPTITR